MIRYAQALELLRDAASDMGLLPFSSVPLRDADGRVVASPIACATPVPPFDNSAMDGYVLRSQDAAAATRETPVRLPLLGSLAAGDPPPSASGQRGAYEIMTGAQLPAGYDAVLKVEEARRSDDGSLLLTAAVEPGTWVRPAGEDFPAGATVVEAGTRLDARHLMALAAVGVERVPVRWRPKVALLATGRELVEPGAPLAPGQIRNSSAPFLRAALERLGAEPRSYGTVADDPVDFKQRLDAALGQENDVIVTTGAVSMGRHDFVASAVAEMGGEVLFHKVALRPGKPGLAARFGHGPLFLGLPGNPVSTVVGLRFFLAPVLRQLLGQPAERPLRARLATAVAKPLGLRCFLKAALRADESGLSARALPGQASSQVRPLLAANGWAILPEEGDETEAGAVIDAAPIWPDEPCWAASAQASAPPARREGCC